MGYRDNLDFGKADPDYNNGAFEENSNPTG